LVKSFMLDVRNSVRTLWRKPGLSATVVASLVVGIGANTAIFTAVDAVLLHPLPIENLERLVMLCQLAPGESDPGTLTHFSFAEIGAYRRSVRTLSAVAAYQRLALNAAAGGEAERVWGAVVSANYFEVLGLAPALGRFFQAAEDRTPGTHPVAVLSHQAWVRRFGAAPDAVGRRLTVNGFPFTVVGVAPAGFQGTEVQVSIDFWVPTMMYKQVAPNPELFDQPDTVILAMLGRLAPGTTLETANGELAGVGPVVAREVGKAPLDLVAKAYPLADSAILPRDLERYQGYGRNLVLAVGMVLLICCVNVANLLLVRGFDRSRELATRQALGATRRSLVRHLLTETLLLFLVGGALAVPAAVVGLRFLWSFRPPELVAAAIDLSLPGRALAFLAAVTLATGLASGLVPALRSTRPDLVADLKDSAGRPTVRLRGWTPRYLVVVPQLALALVALIWSGLLWRNLENVRRIDLGFEPGRLLALTVSPGAQGYDETRARAYYDRVLERAESVPGVESAALGFDRLLRGGIVRRQVYLEGEAVPPEGDGRTFRRTTVVSPGFFATVGLAVRDGRDFEATYPEGAPLAAIINETMAETCWPGESALGKRFSFDYPTEPKLTVAAVVEDARYRYVHEDPQFFIYLPLAQHYVPFMTLHARTAGDPAGLLGTVRDEVRRVDPALPLADAATMPAFVREALWMERTATTMVGLFGLTALILATVGVYGVMRYAVRRRQREFGIRIALGAGRRDLLRTLLGESALVAALGVVAGSALALALAPVLRGQLFGVAAVDPAVYLGQSAVLFVVAVLGGYLPARRAARTDPTTSLRGE
jgi:predicted permease